MIDRPMKQVSLRKFRTEITELRHVTEVSKRDAEGNIIVLGYWTPYARPEDVRRVEQSGIGTPTLDLVIPEEADPATFRVIGSSADVATAVKPDPLRAVPKPSQRKHR